MEPATCFLSEVQKLTGMEPCNSLAYAGTLSSLMWRVGLPILVEVP